MTSSGVVDEDLLLLIGGGDGGLRGGVLLALSIGLTCCSRVTSCEAWASFALSWKLWISTHADPYAEGVGSGGVIAHTALAVVGMSCRVVAGCSGSGCRVAPPSPPAPSTLAAATLVVCVLSAGGVCAGGALPFPMPLARRTFDVGRVCWRLAS